jgi:Bacterial SH3 domain
MEDAMRAAYHCPAWILAAGLVGLAGAAAAAPGDIHQVTGQLVNLRSSPSDSATIRGKVEHGDELIELRRERGWIGVRVMKTGEEGWIFGDLVSPVARSELGIGVADAGFGELSQDFDRVIGSMGQELGYPLVERVEQASGGTLRILPTRDFLLYGGREAHIATTVAIYQMWKNHENSAPVAVTLLDEDGKPYITIEDRKGGPDLISAPPSLASR